MTEESEEKKLPASEKKLREARRKGQVSHSVDLISGFSLFAALAYIFLIWPSVNGHLSELVQTVTTPGPFEETSIRAIRHSIVLLFKITAPVAAIVVVVTLLFGIIGTRGLVFSAQPLAPRFDNINPAKGLKKIMSLRNVIEFVKGLAKVIFLSALFVVVLAAWLQPMFDAPACGASCTEPMIKAVLTQLGIAAALAFIVIGLIDAPIQRRLFLREMRMTTTEHKREHKDLEGDPLIRQELKRQRRDLAALSGNLGLKNAVVVFAASGRAVALRYVKGETPAPMVVAKAQGSAATEMASQARQLGIPVVEDATVAGPLFGHSGIGKYIPEKFFASVVPHLIRLGLT